MKTMCFLLFAITIFSFLSPVHGAEWFSIGEDRAGNELFFDVESLAQRSGLVKTWMKAIYSDEGRKERIRDRVIRKASVDRYERLSYALELQEIDCVRKEFRILAYADYSFDGGILHKSIMDLQPSEGWELISPDSMGEVIDKIVCPSQPLQKKRESNIIKGEGFLRINGIDLIREERSPL
ncbi:MAG: surface-adhesin E family protein [Syntrophorhabdus sp.]